MLHVGRGDLVDAVPGIRWRSASVSLIAASVEGRADPVGAITVAFGEPPDVTRYLSTHAIIDLGDDGVITASDPEACVRLPDLSEETGPLDVVIRCAAVMR